MSYSILYRAAFLKLNDDTYVPVGETGDNNVYDCERRRRSRSWSSSWSMFHGRLGWTEDEIIAAAQKVVDDTVLRYADIKREWDDRIYSRDEVLKQFGYFEALHLSGQNGCSAQQFIGWFRKGIRNARTLDELHKWGVRVYVGSYNKDGHYEKSSVMTEDELRGTYDRLRSEGRDAWISYSDIADVTFRLMCGNGECKRREPRTSGFVIRLVRGGWVHKKTPRRIFTTPDQDYAHIYASRRDAQQAAESLERLSLAFVIEERTAKAA